MATAINTWVRGETCRLHRKEWAGIEEVGGKRDGLEFNWRGDGREGTVKTGWSTVHPGRAAGKSMRPPLAPRHHIDVMAEGVAGGYTAAQRSRLVAGRKGAIGGGEWKQGWGKSIRAGGSAVRSSIPGLVERMGCRMGEQKGGGRRLRSQAARVLPPLPAGQTELSTAVLGGVLALRPAAAGVVAPPLCR